MFGPSKTTLKLQLANRDFMIADLKHQLRKAQEEAEALSIQKDPQHAVGALEYTIYKAKVLDKIGNSYLSGTDNPSFKLGIQFALRHFEEVAVIGR